MDEDRKRRFDTLLADVTEALAVLHRSLPELLAEAKRAGAEEVKERIIHAASSVDFSVAEQRRAAEGAPRARRGSAREAIEIVLSAHRANGLEREPLFAELKSNHQIARNTAHTALKRMLDADQAIEIDGTIFLAEAAEDDTGEEASEEPVGPALSDRSDLWTMGVNDAAA